MEVEDFQSQSCFMLAIIFMLNIVGQGLGEEYISKPYFENHEILNDSKFERFLKDEISFDSCKIRKLALQRNLIGEGSHRRLSSLIMLELSELYRHPCEVIVIERLPSGVFADPFELQHLVQRRGVFRDAAVFGDTNLELPSFRSNRSLVEVHLEIIPRMLSEDLEEVEISVELPLHTRYQPLGHGFSKVEFDLPDILLHCGVEGNLHKQSCLLVSTDQNAKSEEGTVVWEVPCGNKEHSEIVSIVTFISAIFSAFLIVLISISYSNCAIGGDLKQC